LQYHDFVELGLLAAVGQEKRADFLPSKPQQYGTAPAPNPYLGNLHAHGGPQQAPAPAAPAAPAAQWPPGHIGIMPPYSPQAPVSQGQYQPAAQSGGQYQKSVGQEPGVPGGQGLQNAQQFQGSFSPTPAPNPTGPLVVGTAFAGMGANAAYNRYPGLARFAGQVPEGAVQGPGLISRLGTAAANQIPALGRAGNALAASRLGGMTGSLVNAARPVTSAIGGGLRTLGRGAGVVGGLMDAYNVGSAYATGGMAGGANLAQDTQQGIRDDLGTMFSTRGDVGLGDRAMALARRGLSIYNPIENVNSIVHGGRQIAGDLGAAASMWSNNVGRGQRLDNQIAQTRAGRGPSIVSEGMRHYLPTSDPRYLPLPGR
jgi:hypothetical protein